ncbi:hypothetical protein PVAND_015355 [Polypedilum vanderplanki]|uniref:Uncharacterized protein n=1 Tax=Polypedilum vanderplanki TaxID=319348 RepID=A0A9J6BCD2_POLVA|nr:hypothetical protein PVAND_015355 [Polypedilum vanderplanki]
MKFQLSILLLALAASSHAIDVGCLIRRATWGGGNLLTCFAQNVTESLPCANPDEQEELNITNPPTDFPDGTTEEDLEGISIKDRRLPHFPKRLYKKFKKLRAIECDNTGLENLTDEDFRGLTILVYISFPRNRFKMLPGRLFRFTPNLQWVRFHGNPSLTNIGFNLFKHLFFLRELNFSGSGCANVIETNPSLLTRLAGLLMGKCPPDPDDFEEDMNNMECSFKDSGSKEKSNEKKLKELNLGETGCTNTTVTDTTSVATTTGDLLSECPPDPKDLEEDFDYAMVYKIVHSVW